MRIHEHAHGIIRYIESIIRVYEKLENSDFQLNNELEESLAELVTVTAINNYGDDVYRKLFYILDEYTPSFYQNWKILDMFLKTLGESVKERIPLKWVLVLIEYIKEKKINKVSEIGEANRKELTSRIIIESL